MQSHKIVLKLAAAVLVVAASLWQESAAQTPDSLRKAGLQMIVRDSTAAVDSLDATDTTSLFAPAVPADSAVKGMLDRPAFSTAVDSVIEDFSSGRQMIYYYGDASVTYGDMKLAAEYMEYDVERQVVYAAGVADTAGVITGKPEMTQGGKTYVMDNVFYNFKTNKARIRNMTTQEEDGTLMGDNLSMLPDRSINISGGKYTVCDADHPHFYLRMTKAKVETQPKQKTVFGPAYLVLEDDYTSNYQGFDPNNPESYIIFSLLQNAHLEQSLDFATLVQQSADSGPVGNNRGVKQANFLVLWKCTMPAVLIEMGFISNTGDMRTLTDKNSQQRIASNIFKAFQAYKKSYDTDIYLPDSEGQGKQTSVQAARKDSGKFGIQILASSYLLPDDAKEFKGWRCSRIKSGRNYKYYIGEYSTRDEAVKALPRIRNSFPEAFIIRLDQ